MYVFQRLTFSPRLISNFRSSTCVRHQVQRCGVAPVIPSAFNLLLQTSQLLEALHAHDTSISTSFPPGFLIANDSDNKRTHLLIHQSARLPSPAFMVTNLDASIYPVIKLPVEGPNARKTATLLFDRILCDVPCSGDGTLRKNVGIWKSWNPGDGNGLHRYTLPPQCTRGCDQSSINLVCSFGSCKGP
jgi:hypothetical protein